MPHQSVAGEKNPIAPQAIQYTGKPIHLPINPPSLSTASQAERQSTYHLHSGYVSDWNCLKKNNRNV